MKKVLLLTLLIMATFIAGCAQRVPAQTAWNNGFEGGMEDWNVPVIKPRPGQKPGKNEVKIVEAPAHRVHEGKRALQFEAGSWSPNITITSKTLPLLANAQFQSIRVWELYEGPRGRQFGLKIQLYDSAKAPLADAVFNRKGSDIPDGDWFPNTLNFEVPQNARYYSVELYWSVGTGKVTFDDISLSATTAPIPLKTGYSLPQFSNAQREVWVASALEKIYPDATKPQAMGNHISMSAARGESQSVQLVYKPRDAQTSLSVSADDLKSSDSSKVLSAKNIDIRYVGYVDVKSDVSQFGRGGLTPDPLYPRSPETIEAGRPQPIWVTVTVPRDAPSGKYSSFLHVKTAQQTMDIPLQLEVYDFVLPPKPFLKTEAHNSGAAPSARENLRRHLLANRITTEIGYGGGVQSLKLTLNPDNSVTVDWASWDAIMQKYFSDGMDQFLVPCMLFGNISGMYHNGVWQYVGLENKITYGTPEWRTAVSSYVQQMYAHLQQKGWLQNAVWEIWDEPMGTKMRATVKDIAALVRANAPDAKIMVTGWPTEPVDPNIDIWCPQQSLYQPNLREISDKEFWIYNNGLFILDNPVGLTKMRNEEWWMWNNDISGLLWWSISYGWQNLYSNLTPYPKQNGNGFLFYPGPDGDVSQVIDTMRVAAYRSGVNDYDYFTLLASAQDIAIQKSNLSGKVPSGKQLVKVLLSAGLDKNDPDLLEQIRVLTARLIVFMRQHPGVALQLDNNYWTSKQANAMGPGFSQKVLLTLADKSTFTVSAKL